MLARTRKSGIMDMGRLSNALARPGMDTRTWASLAVITDVFVDPDHGPLADLMLIPSGAEETARFGAVYAGTNFGLYAPLEIDDEVLVVAPSGDPDAGLVIVSRLWSAADPPPVSASDKPADLILFAKEGASVHIAVSGAGQVHLGTVDSTHPVPRGDDLQARFNAFVSQFNAHFHVETGVNTNPVIPAQRATASPASDLSPNVKVT